MPDIPPSLPAAFLNALGASPEKRFLHFEGRSYRYGDLHHNVCRVAASLEAWGLRKGERVALYLENSPSFVSAYLGVLWLGGVIVPVNTRYRETELRHMLTDSGARLVVTDGDGGREIGKVSTHAPLIERVVEVGGGLERDLDAWRTLADGEPLLEPLHLTPDDLAVIAYTSGTTGRSKGAMLTHGNFMSNSAAVTQAWGWTEEDHLLLALPLFHIHGLGVGLHGTLLQGSTLTLKSKFAAKDAFETLLEGRVNMFFGVPTMYSRLLAEAKGRPERPRGLRLFVSGSAPLSPQLLGEVEREFGLRILERYGMTETVMNLGNPLTDERRAGSVGLPFTGVEVRIVNPVTGEVSQGETGEIQLRGPNVFKGYWRQEGATREAFTHDGWFRTGDLGYRDAEGYTYLSGRAKELIISGGFNVYPREVEEVLEACSGVREAAVFGLPDPDLGERVATAVVAEDAALEAAALQRYCKEHLAGYKGPKEIYYVESLPRNALGKVQKHLLQELFKKDRV